MADAFAWVALSSIFGSIAVIVGLYFYLLYTIIFKWRR